MTVQIPPELKAVAERYPSWEVYLGADRRPWARLRADNRVRVRGEDPVDLEDEIKAQESRMAGVKGWLM